MWLYIYIYIYIERERERENYYPIVGYKITYSIATLIEGDTCMALPILRSCAQCFRDANRGRVYVHAFISFCECACMHIDSMF